MKYLIILSLLVSCGKIKIEPKPIEVKTDIPESIAFGPDFAKAAEFCDARYGANSVESESCFEDYRRFLSPKLQVDFGSINQFCKSNYAAPQDILACEQEILDIFKGSGTIQ